MITEKEKILIVDDDKFSGKILENIFKKNGYETSIAATGEEALVKAAECIYNLALLDIMLPDMEGTDLIKPLRALHSDIEIVMVTAHSSHERAIAALNKGASGYITKPVNPDNVLSVIRGVLEKQQLIFKNRQLYLEVQKELAEGIRLSDKLKEANKTIIEQQNALIEEERLKVLLQMAGATASELNQPLSSILENIEFIRIHQDDPNKIRQKIIDIESAGKKIADTVGKIQWIRHEESYKDMQEMGISFKDQELNILSVEDEKNFFTAIKRLLRKYRLFTLHHSENITDALNIIKNKKIDLILLDFLLPDGNSFDFLRKLGEMNVNIPVVIITGHGDEVVASQLMLAGAYDYLPKTGISEESLYNSIKNTVQKSRFKKEINKAIDKIAEMSTKDALTTLYNRRYFTEALEREIGRARRYEKDLTLCMVDIDHFKHVNDTYGHVAGDMVLKETAQVLKNAIRDSDIACRFGGEEFSVILLYADIEASKIIGERFRRAMEEYDFKFESSLIKITVSVGVAYYNRKINTSQLKFIELADSALYQAKREGRNRVVTC